MFLDSGVVQLTRRCRAWPCRPGPASGVDAVSAIDLEWQDGHPGSKGQGTDLLCYPAPSHRGAWTNGADALPPALVRAHATRTDSGRPNSSIRFRARAAMATSVARPGSVRERSVPPITRL